MIPSADKINKNNTSAIDKPTRTVKALTVLSLFGEPRMSEYIAEPKALIISTSITMMIAFMMG